MTLRYYLTDDQMRECAGLYQEHFPQDAAVTIQTAERAVTGSFKIANSMLADRWVVLGSPVDWLHNPSSDPEFSWVLNRHYHMKELGKAYLLTGEVKYADTYMEQIRCWRIQNPAPMDEAYEDAVYFQKKGPWRLLETGIRPQSWIFGYECLKLSGRFDQDFERELEHGLAEHAEYLSRYLGDTDINHAVMHMQGLFAIGVFLHKHPRAPYWRQLALERLELCMHAQIGEDGIQKELSIHYHNGCITWFSTPYLLGRRTGYPFPASYAGKLEKMAAFTAATIRPDGFSSAISDSDCNEYGTQNITLLGSVLGKPEYAALGKPSAELLWIAGAEALRGFADQAQIDGDRFRQPLQGLTVFPTAGYSILRTPDNYVFFDAAPLGGAHGHADALSFEWFYQGKAVCLDTGRYTYAEGEWRRYFKSPAAHNTVAVDGQDQSVYVSSQQWQEPSATATLHRAVYDSGIVLLDGEHDGYARLTPPVAHRRWLFMAVDIGVMILVDWIQGEGRHEFMQSFHLHPATTVICEERNWPNTTSATLDVEGSGLRLKLEWHGSDEKAAGSVRLESGWLSRSYGFKEIIPVIRLHGQAEAACGLAVVYVPEHGGWNVNSCEWNVEQRSVRFVLGHAELGFKEIRLDPQHVSCIDVNE